MRLVHPSPPLSLQVGVLGDVITNAKNIVAKGRLGPGQMVVADLETGKFMENAEVSKAIATKHPYKEWIKGQLRGLKVRRGSRLQLRGERDKWVEQLCPTLRQSSFILLHL